MNRVRLLSEHVANQIAAGEVVERPASVVKELVENSLDADARRISVAVRKGGKSLIRVTDDGWGMSRDDALLALERHATSKIARAEDLHSISSLGFRGEAIPSIAAVSRFTLTSRERGALNGTQIEIAGGKIISVQDAGAAEGTVIEARNLFFNLPARRKFLRTDPTETAHVQQVVTLCALAHPGVAFQLVLDDRSVFNLAPATTLIDRLRELYGNQLCAQLVTVGADAAPVSDIIVRGFIGKPGVSRSDRRQQYIFVNGRPVENRTINFGLLEGYHTALMRGQYPVTFLFVDMDPALVDVNIHPAKREVRFHDDALVRQAVIDAVRKALEPTGLTVQPLQKSVRTMPVWTGHTAPVPSHGPSASPTTTHFVPMPPLVLRGEPGPPPPAQQGQLPAIDEQARQPVPVSSMSGAPSMIEAGENGRWRILGAIGKLYVLAESPEGLVLIDQHAAHERVLFEKMLKELEGDAAPSQKLLLPVTLEFDPHDELFVKSNLATLQKLGIGISEFGDRTYLVDALPPYFPLQDLPQLFRNIVDELHQTGDNLHVRRLSEDRIATTVCRHAVKARDPLKGEELRSLLQQLHQCELPYTCPHGRPTMIQIGYAELEKKFGRKV
jgi:DNA mismatch repair protein MutL